MHAVLGAQLIEHRNHLSEDIHIFLGLTLWASQVDETVVGVYPLPQSTGFVVDELTDYSHMGDLSLGHYFGRIMDSQHVWVLGQGKLMFVELKHLLFILEELFILKVQQRSLFITLFILPLKQRKQLRILDNRLNLKIRAQDIFFPETIFMSVRVNFLVKKAYT